MKFAACLWEKSFHPSLSPKYFTSFVLFEYYVMMHVVRDLKWDLMKDNKECFCRLWGVWLWVNWWTLIMGLQNFFFLIFHNKLDSYVISIYNCWDNIFFSFLFLFAFWGSLLEFLDFGNALLFCLHFLNTCRPKPNGNRPIRIGCMLINSILLNGVMWRFFFNG